MLAIITYYLLQLLPIITYLFLDKPIHWNFTEIDSGFALLTECLLKSYQWNIIERNLEIILFGGTIFPTSLDEIPLEQHDQTILQQNNSSLYI